MHIHFLFLQEFDSDDTNMTVCDLEPNSQYEFSIVTRPGKYIGYPSDPVVNYTVTFIDRKNKIICFKLVSCVTV